MKDSSRLFFFSCWLPWPVSCSASVRRAGLGSHRHQSGQRPHPHCRGGLQAGGRRSPDAGAEGHLRRHALTATWPTPASSTWCRRAWRRRQTPGSPQEINLAQWSRAPANAAMVAFGALSADNGRLAVYGWLFDTRNTANPAGAGQAVQRSGQPGHGAHHRAPLCR